LAYNDLGAIKKNINLLYQNIGVNFKVFILDNNSKDLTKEYLRRTKEEKDNLYINLQDHNLGVIKGRNECYQFSKEIDKNCSHILFLDADQYVLEGWLESYLEYFNEAWLMREKDCYPYKRLKSKEESNYFNYCGCGGLMVKSSVFEELGGFDERYDKYYFEDPDFCWTAHEAGYKIGWNYNEVIFHEKHNLSLSGERKIKFMENWSRFRDKWNGSEMPVFRVE